MNNKVCVELIVPDIDQTYDLFIPINKKIGNILLLINKSLVDVSKGVFKPNDKNFLYNKYTGERYDINITVKKSSIKNGTVLVLY